METALQAMHSTSNRWLYRSALLVLVVGFFFRSLFATRNVAERAACYDVVWTAMDTRNKNLIGVVTDLLEINPDAALGFLEHRYLSGHYEDVTNAVVEVIIQQEGYPWTDISVPPASCGSSKCMFHSISQNTTAYLIARPTRNNEPFASGISYRNELDLIERFKIPQLSLESPYPVLNISHNMMRLLNSYGLFKKDKLMNATLYVQRIRKVPQPSLEVHSSRGVTHNLPAFARILRKRNAATNNTTISSFREQYLLEKERLYHILNSDDSQQLSLLFDFQFMLGLDGRWYYLDLDRKFQVNQIKFPSSNELHSFFQKLNQTIDTVLYWLTEASPKHFHTSYPKEICVATYHCKFKEVGDKPQHTWDTCHVTCG